ncbi:MAG: hypothetical protein HYS62_03190 [Candidatus Aenigmarchaeota archaeon]|nr:hypothetical protein [Candidatus Aenigmarchaeota archaeon]
MNLRRSKIRVLVDILRAVEENEMTKPTHIMYKANLSHKLLKEHLDMLSTSDFIEKMNRGNNVYYQITEKGKRFMLQYRQMEKVATGFGLTI